MFALYSPGVLVFWATLIAGFAVAIADSTGLFLIAQRPFPSTGVRSGAAVAPSVVGL